MTTIVERYRLTSYALPTRKNSYQCKAVVLLKRFDCYIDFTWKKCKLLISCEYLFFLQRLL